MKAVSSRFVCVIALSFSWAIFAQSTHENFLLCLSNQSENPTISKVIYTSHNSSFASVLDFSIRNLRFSAPNTPKPLVIVTPLEVAHIQATINCSKNHDMQIRVRSGGHDYEGLSYVSDVPFVVVDLINLRTIEVDVGSRSAWVQAGATLGEVYYRIAEESRNLAFSSGVCPTVGVGGHYSGGGYGTMFRKYGLAADNIIDAHLIDLHGRVLDRESMGEDLFWAIRGGGGVSFGIIVAWKLRLLPVPSTVTVFTVQRTLEQNATKLVHRWQYIAPNLPEDVLIAVFLTRINSSQNGMRTIQASFTGSFIGGADQLLPLVQQNFPDLGLVREDYIEMSWIESMMYFGGFSSEDPFEALLDRTPPRRQFFKAKSDYVKEPIPEPALRGIWERFFEEEGKLAQMIFSPHGAKMSEIPESETPFPHRKGILFMIQHLVYWEEEGTEAANRHVNWIRKLYKYMTPYVSRNPREAYLNYRDLDIGVNEKGNTTYEKARTWAVKYFKNNFDRLVRVKTKTDPVNFFRNEQSIPPLLVTPRRADL